jgi:putative Mg2+ transporter-C (MgtC) family protein
LTLLVLKWIDVRIPRDHRAELDVAWEDGKADDLPEIVKPLGYRARSVGLERRPDRDDAVFSFEIGWTRPDRSGPQRICLH